MFADCSSLFPAAGYMDFPTPTLQAEENRIAFKFSNPCFYGYEFEHGTDDGTHKCPDDDFPFTYSIYTSHDEVRLSWVRLGTFAMAHVVAVCAACMRTAKILSILVRKFKPECIVITTCAWARRRLLLLAPSQTCPLLHRCNAN